MYKVWSVSLWEWSQGNLLFLWIKDLDESSMAIQAIYVQYMPCRPSGSRAIIKQNHRHWRFHARQQAKTMPCLKGFGAWSCVIQEHGHIHLSIYGHLQDAGWYGRYLGTDIVFRQEQDRCPGCGGPQVLISRTYVSLERSSATQIQRQTSIHYNLDESEQSVQAETGKGTYLRGCECVYHPYLMLSFSHGSYSSLVMLHK